MLHDIMGLDRAAPWLILSFAVGYLAGSVPFGLILARVFGLGDLRKVGSGNIGATNVLRTGNKLAAALTLLLDFAKGLVPVLIFLQWGDLAAQAAGLGAVLGHCLPVWLRFKGGKGIATAAGVVFGLAPLAGLAVAAVWLLVAFATRISSAGALAATAAAPGLFWVIDGPRAVLCMIILAVWIWIRHRENIGRLLRGTEPKIGAGKTKSEG
ncbi:MAG: glycerol-3-phosphate 1-O-acyltransferase PlsY [Pseudomonadota bacterium]